MDESIDQLVDRMLLRLDVVASNAKDEEPVDQPVDQLIKLDYRLDAVAVSYCTTGNRSTGYMKRSSGWMQ